MYFAIVNIWKGDEATSTLSSLQRHNCGLVVELTPVMDIIMEFSTSRTSGYVECDQNRRHKVALRVTSERYTIKEARLRSDWNIELQALRSGPCLLQKITRYPWKHAHTVRAEGHG